MSETISKSLGEGHGKGELYAALAHDTGDKFGGMEIKSILMNFTTYDETTGDGRVCFANRDMYVAPYTTTELDIVASDGVWIMSNNIYLVGDVHFFGTEHETSTAEFDVLLTDPTTAANAMHGLIDAGGAWTAGNMVAVRGKVDVSGGLAICSATGVWAGLEFVDAVATGTGLTCALNAEVVSDNATKPNAIVYIQSLPGAGADFSNVPYIAFTEEAGGTGSNILFEVGHDAAAKVPTLESDMLFWQDTLRIAVNKVAGTRTKFYIPLSTVTGTFTYAYLVALTNVQTIDVTLTSSLLSALAITTTSADTTGGSTVILPLYVDATMSGDGGLGRAIEGKLTVSGKLGSYGNAIKGYTDLTGGTGTSGLASAICAEMKMSAGATLGTFGVLEIELVCPTSWTAGGGVGTNCTSFIYAQVSDDASAIGEFEHNGYLLNLQGLSDDTSHLWYDNTLRIAIGSTAWYIPMSTAAGSFTTAYPIVFEAVTGHAIDITDTWGTGLTGAAISVGDYSSAVAFGAISEHVLGIVSHLSADFDDDSNAIPILGKFTLEGDSDSAVVQCILGQGVCNYNVADMYGVRGSIAISGSPEVNQIFGVFASMTTTSCNVAATGAIALFGGTITGSADITRTGATAVMCGMYLNWNVTTVSMTIPVYGIMVNINASAYVDYGIIVHGGYCNEAAFCSSGTSHDVAFEVKDAHTYAFKFPAIGTSPCSAYTTEEAPTGKIKIRVGTQVRYLAYWD